MWLDWPSRASRRASEPSLSVLIAGDLDDTKQIAAHLERIATETGLTVPAGFRFVSYVQGKCGVELRGNNIRDCIDQLPDALRRYKGKAGVAA